LAAEDMRAWAFLQDQHKTHLGIVAIMAQDQFVIRQLYMDIIDSHDVGGGSPP